MKYISYCVFYVLFFITAVGPHLMSAKPAVQATVQRNKAARPTLNDYQRESQNLALSFKSNPSVTDTSNPVENQNSQPQFTSMFGDQYSRLASNDNQINPPKPDHDLLQTFYPNALHQDRLHEADAIAVGEPLYVQKAHVQSLMRAHNKVSTLLKNAMNNFNKLTTNKPASSSTLNGVGVKPLLYKKPVKNLHAKTSPVESIDDPHADMRDPSESIDNQTPQEPGIDDQPADQAVNSLSNKPSKMPLAQGPGEEVRPVKPASNINGLGKPVVTGTPTFLNQPQNTVAHNSASPAVADKVKTLQPTINLDVLKDKILHTTNATFLRRMLALIQKITHHKDFHKLQAPARSFVAQANTAVQALNNAYNERVSSSPVTMGIDYPLSKKSAVQRFNQAYNINQRISASPINLGTVNQLYGNNYKKSTVQSMNNQAYNNRISAASPLNMATGNPLYGNNYSVSKKFQIARNPYYQNYYQYRQPYYSNLQSMQYGLYNGNQP